MGKGMFSRAVDITKANINVLLDGAEDPEKMIKQMVIDMEAAVNKSTSSVGVAIANEKRLEREYENKKKQAEEWERKAMLAVEKGNDDLGRKALERKTALTTEADDLSPVLEEARNTSRYLRAQLDQLKTKLEEARVRQGTLIARHRAAQAKKELAQSVSGLGGDAFASFDRFEQKIETSESEADAHAELAGEDSLDDEFAKLEQEGSADNELVALKEKMKKK